MIIYDETRELHPLRECIGKTIVGTGNSAHNVSLTFTDGTVLIFNIGFSDSMKVSLQERSQS